MTNNGTGDIGQPTISGGSLSYTFQGQARSEVAWSMRLNVFTAPVGPSPSSMTITVDDDNNDAIYNYTVYVLAYRGYNTSTPIAGFVTSNTADIGDGAETQTLAATPTTSDVTLSAWLYDADNKPANPTLTAGWSTIYDNGGIAGGATIALIRRESSTSTSVEVTDIYTAAANFYKAAMFSFIVKSVGGTSFSPSASPSA